MNKELKELIASDLYRYGIQNEKDLSLISRHELYGFRYMKVLRKTKFYKDHRKHVRYIIYRLKLMYYTEKYGFSISYSTEIGKGFYLGHKGSIIVNYKAKIGNNVNLAQGVTIGMANGGKHKGVPIISDNVWIGANSTVVGGIIIGEDVMIAPNTFVNFDVPPHSIVISNKAKIIERNPATINYIENKWGEEE